MKKLPTVVCCSVLLKPTVPDWVTNVPVEVPAVVCTLDKVPAPLLNWDDVTKSDPVLKDTREMEENVSDAVEKLTVLTEARIAAEP